MSELTVSPRPTSTRPGLRPVAGAGVLAAPAAAAGTAAAAALARAAGVELAVAGEPIPVSGVAFVTVVLSLVGVVLAVALARWSTRPAAWFVRTTAALLAVSLVPPFLADASTATSLTLGGLHLLAAAIVVPTLASRLRR